MTDEDKKALALRLRQIRDTFGVMFESPRLNENEKAILLAALQELYRAINSLGFLVDVGREGKDEATIEPGTEDSPNGWKGYL